MIDKKLINELYENRVEELTNMLESMPQQVVPVITQSDADSGYVIRYFIRQANDKTFITEIDNNQYQTLKDNPRFVVTQIKWKIVGKLETIKYSTGVNLYGIKDQNRITVADADLTFGGLRNYIKNYGEFWLREN